VGGAKAWQQVAEQSAKQKVIHTHFFFGQTAIESSGGG